MWRQPGSAYTRHVRARCIRVALSGHVTVCHGYACVAARLYGSQILLDVMSNLTVVVPEGPLTATDDLYIFVDNCNMYVCIASVMNSWWWCVVIIVLPLQTFACALCLCLQPHWCSTVPLCQPQCQWRRGI